MENKTPKIHQLKGKSRLNPQAAPVLMKSTSQLIEISPNLPQMSYQTSKPILIRYIDPRLVPIFKEFSTLTTKCQEIVQTVRESPQLAQHEKIEELLQSTKKINDQFHEIIDNTEQTTTQPFKEDSQSFSPAATEAAVEKSSNQNQEILRQEEVLNPIETVNRASERMEELQKENSVLKYELQKQKKRSNEVELENKELKYKLSKLEKQKKEILINIRSQLQRLKDDNGLKNLPKISEVHSQ